MCLLRRTSANLCSNMIHFDAVDFSECHSEEVISFFWRSVYVAKKLLNLWGLMKAYKRLLTKSIREIYNFHYLHLALMLLINLLLGVINIQTKHQNECISTCQRGTKITRYRVVLSSRLTPSGRQEVCTIASPPRVSMCGWVLTWLVPDLGRGRGRERRESLHQKLVMISTWKQLHNI